MKKAPTKTMTMVEYVNKLKQDIPLMEYEDISETFANNTIIYANFLSSPIKLGDFIPTDLEGNILEKPEEWKFEIEANVKRSGWAYLVRDKEHGDDRYYDKEAFLKAKKKYQEALDRLVYSGFGIVEANGSKWVRKIIDSGSDETSHIVFQWIQGKWIYNHTYTGKREFHEDLANLRLDYTEQQVKRLGL